MHGTKQIPTYDLAARAAIRARLLAYMCQHGIGTPTLAKRIKAALPLKPDIPVSTLQRFLAGETISNGGLVAQCAKFVEGLPVIDPVADIGKAIATFCGDADGTAYAGNYRQKDDLAEIRIDPDNGFCRVDMFEYQDGSRERRKHSEGALVGTHAAHAVMVIRDTLRFFSQAFLLFKDGNDLKFASATGGIAVVAEWNPSGAQYD